MFFSSRDNAHHLFAGVIASSDIWATSHEVRQEAAQARPNSPGGGWQPEMSDEDPCITVNLRTVLPIHGFGTLGHAHQPCYVKTYHVFVSNDSKTYQPLLEKSTIDTDHPTARVSIAPDHPTPRVTVYQQITPHQE